MSRNVVKCFGGYRNNPKLRKEFLHYDERKNSMDIIVVDQRGKKKKKILVLILFGPN